MYTRLLIALIVLGGILPFPGYAKSTQICRDFNAIGVSHVVFRAKRALDTTIAQSPKPGTVSVCGVAKVGAEGYHSPDPNWRETPPSEWGLDFKAKRFGSALAISTENEIQYIHHYYYLDYLVVNAPEGITVQRIKRKLTGDGSPSMSSPSRA